MDLSLSSQYQLFHALFETSLDAMLLTQPDGTCWRANHAAVELLGYSNEEFVALRRRDLIDEADPATGALIKERTAKGFVRGMLRFRRKDGSWFDAQFSSFLFAAPDGNTWAGTTLRDMTEQLRLRKELQDANAGYLNIIEGLFEGVIEYDAAGRPYACNQSALRLLGLTFDQLKGRTPLDPRWRIVQKDGSHLPPERYPTMVALATGRAVRDVEMGVYRSDDELVWLRVNANPLFRPGEARPYAVVTAFEDMTQRIKLELELRKQLHTDVLTGVANRRAFMERVRQTFDFSRRSGMPVAALMLDIDEFKEINDSYGHAVGDDILKAVAETLQGELRSSDYLARVGGDEFCILLPNTDWTSAAEMTRRLKRAIADMEILGGCERIPIAIAIGYATLAAGDPDIRTWLHRADQALYADKSGKTPSAGE